MCGVIHAGHVEIALHPGRFFARKILQRFVCADVLIVLDGFLQQGLCFLGCATLRRPSSATTHNEPWNQSRSDDAHHFPPTVHYPMRSTNAPFLPASLTNALFATGMRSRSCIPRNCRA